MTRIAVCEDNEMERTVLMELILAWARKRNVEIELEGFADGEELLEDFKKCRYDLLFLDILMEQVDGIEAGKAIREMDAKTEIVYCTSCSTFALEAYEVHARDYLLKPYDPEKIGETLDKYTK